MNRDKEDKEKIKFTQNEIDESNKTLKNMNISHDDVSLPTGRYIYEYIHIFIYVHIYAYIFVFR
jgi:hypothetical protein